MYSKNNFKILFQQIKKADAWKEYQEAAMVDMVLQTLPKVAAEIAAPLTRFVKYFG